MVKDADISKVTGMQEFQLKDTIPGNGFSADVYRQCINNLSKDTLVVTKFDETLVTGTINLSEDKMMYLSIPYDYRMEVKGRQPAA